MYRAGSFQEKLQAVLRERGMGYRSLAKLLEPDNVEQARKSVRRWMSVTKPTSPSRSSRDAVTDALGLERGSLDDDEDVDQALMRELRDTRERFARIEQLIEGRR